MTARPHVTKGGRNSDPQKLAFIRREPCFGSTKEPEVCAKARYMAAHHDREGGARASDRRAVPLCEPGHHQTGPRALEVIGREAFEAVHGSLSGAAVRYEERYQAWREEAAF